MRLGPRAKLAALLAMFALPIVASVLAYTFLDVRPTANYGELITPPGSLPAGDLASLEGAPFAPAAISGRWVLVVSDSGACGPACVDKLVTIRQARLALGRNAGRMERLFLVGDAATPSAEALAPFPGMQVARVRAAAAGSGPVQDPAHIYLVDPNGNVMMRWPARPDPRRMVKDLERLLKASQIG